MSTYRKFSGIGNEWNWENAPEKLYTGRDVEGVVRKMLISDIDGEPNFYFRYFCVPPGGNTAYDQHTHDHGVMILHGKARVVIEGREYIAEPKDIVYISPNHIHQFFALGDEPLGFLCVIDPNELDPATAM